MDVGYSLSADGRYIAYEDPNEGVKILDRGTIAGVDLETLANGSQPSMSADGTVVTFLSPAGLNVHYLKSTTEVIVAGTVVDPVLSAQGHYVTFSSTAQLVPEDTNNIEDIYVFDLVKKTMERVGNGDNNSRFPQISGDGSYVVFYSEASNLLGVDINNDSVDSNGVADVFVYDRGTKIIQRVNVSAGGAQDGEGVPLRSQIPSHAALCLPGPNCFPHDLRPVSISDDGRTIAFQSSGNNIVPNDSNNTTDVFLVPNPLIEAGLTRAVEKGDRITNLNFGLVPDKGTISGRVFEDVVANGIYDEGEPVVVAAKVFLDLNHNRRLDLVEPSSETNTEGIYEFKDIAAFRSYTIVAQSPVGFEQIGPSVDQNFVWSIFLPAGGDVSDRDFAFRSVSSTGQSSASAVSGRLYEDKNSNGVFDAGIDTPIANREVYFDASNFGVRDANEPRVLTDSNGMYSFAGLSSRNVAVSTTLDPTLVHVTPLGSDFQLAKYPLFPTVQPFGNPQSIGSGDFNGDGFVDVAVALGEGNKLSIRLNDGSGGFLPDQINVDLGQAGSGPTSLVLGYFDENPLDIDAKLDVALTANFAGNVTVLLNFDPATSTFASTSYVKVGDEPLDIAAGQFDGDTKPDLVVVNKVGNTVKLLTNNGSGVFTASTTVPSGGKGSSSIVVGRFTGDEFDDVAVVHSSPLDSTSPLGGVTVLAGNGAGGLMLQPNYVEVGALPIDSVTADFNKDGRADIAVANFSSNSISVLLGQADGTFKVQSAILGTASGAFDIAFGDVDNDGDVDLIASNLRDRNISIFRNDGPDPTTGDVRFQPLENIGLGQFSLAQRMPLVVANFDNDTSGPGGTGTIDIVTIPQKTDTLHVLKNSLVNGARRVALTGLNAVTGVDFIIKLAILPPSFDAVPNSMDIFEDAAQRSVAINGITKGRTTGPGLQFSVTSSNPTLISTASVAFSSGTLATVNFTPAPEQTGVSVLTVRAVDAGADGLFGGADDGIFERSITVNVLAVNDPPMFSLVSEASARQTDGVTTIPNFLFGIGNGGSLDEDSQTRDALIVTATDPSYFTIPPAIDEAGTLTFTPSLNRSGVVQVTVTLSDSGGKDNGGNDTTTRSFLINILPVNDAPSFTIAGDLTIEADAGPQIVSNFASGFLPGGGSDEASQAVSDYLITVDNPSLFSVLPKIGSSGTLQYTPASDRAGTAIVSVQVRDTGGRENGGNDLSPATTFTIEFLTPIDNSLIVLTGSDETFDMSSQADATLATVTRIDIRGTGRNSLVLDAPKIATLTPNKTLVVIADQGDSIDFGEGWQFETVEAVDGRMQRIFTNGAAIVRVVGPMDWTNPVITGDVNGNGDVTAGDALDILFSLRQPQLFNSQGMLVDAATVTPANFRFYDVNEDGTSTAADALFVINLLFLQSIGGSGEGELSIPQSDWIKYADSTAERQSKPSEESTIYLSDVGQIDLTVSATAVIDTSVVIDSATSDRDDEADRESDLDATLAAVWDWIE